MGIKFMNDEIKAGENGTVYFSCISDYYLIYFQMEPFNNNEVKCYRADFNNFNMEKFNAFAASMDQLRVEKFFF